VSFCKGEALIFCEIHDSRENILFVKNKISFIILQKLEIWKSIVKLPEKFQSEKHFKIYSIEKHFNNIS